jgi:hypothetical protein
VGIPVLDQRRLPLGSELAGGQYTIVVRVLRNSDSQSVPAQPAGWVSAQAELPIGTLTLVE